MKFLSNVFWSFYIISFLIFVFYSLLEINKLPKDRRKEFHLIGKFSLFKKKNPEKHLALVYWGFQFFLYTGIFISILNLIVYR